MARVLKALCVLSLTFIILLAIVAGFALMMLPWPACVTAIIPAIFVGAAGCVMLELRD